MPHLLELSPQVFQCQVVILELVETFGVSKVSCNSTAELSRSLLEVHIEAAILVLLLLLLEDLNINQLLHLAYPLPLGFGLHNARPNYAQDVQCTLRHDITLIRLLFLPLLLDFLDLLNDNGLLSVDLFLQRLNLLVHDGSLGLENLLKGKPLTFNDFDANPIIRELEPLRNEKFVA